MILLTVVHGSCGTRFLIVAPFVPGLQYCPSCHGIVDGHLRIESVPSPFGNRLSSAILLKPSEGSWKTFEVGDDLHIGITDSRGVVHSFWTQGIVSECIIPSGTTWEDSIAVNSFDLPDIDAKLNEFIDLQGSNFLPETYDETEWNCFDFIVRFLHFIDRSPLLTKVEFTSQFVEEPLKRAVKYAEVYKEVESRGSLVLRR